LGKFFTLLIAGCCTRLRCGLRLVLGIYSTFGRAYHRLLLFMTGNKGNKEQPGDRRKPGIL
jgi:hypothetical protein